MEPMKAAILRRAPPGASGRGVLHPARRPVRRPPDCCLDLGGRMEEIAPFLRVEEEGEPIACNGEQV